MDVKENASLNPEMSKKHLLKQKKLCDRICAVQKNRVYLLNQF